MGKALEVALSASWERLVAAAVVRPLGDPKPEFIVVDNAGEPMLPTAYGCRFERLAREPVCHASASTTPATAPSPFCWSKGYLSTSWRGSPATTLR